MIINKAVRRGADTNHKDFCEDFLACHTTERYVVGAIFDGCSTGVHSHFASALFGKIFNSTIADYSQEIDLIYESKDPDSTARFVMYHFCKKLYETKVSLDLTDIELLSTMVLLVGEVLTGRCYVIGFGDGFISVDGVRHSMENKKFDDDDKAKGADKPNYIVYDIDKIQERSAFNTWFNRHENQYRFEDAQDITIASDGIETFKKIKGFEIADEDKEEYEDMDPIDFLTDNSWLIKNKAMVQRKCNLIDKKLGHLHADDLSMIRIVFEKVEDKIKYERSRAQSQMA